MLLLGVVSVLAFLALNWLSGFLPVLAVGLLAITAYWCFIPYIEAGLLRLTAGGGMGYGVARGIGSALFVVANIGVGMLIELTAPLRSVKRIPMRCAPASMLLSMMSAIAVESECPRPIAPRTDGSGASSITRATSTSGDPYPPIAKASSLMVLMLLIGDRIQNHVPQFEGHQTASARLGVPVG